MSEESWIENMDTENRMDTENSGMHLIRTKFVKS